MAYLCRRILGPLKISEATGLDVRGGDECTVLLDASAEFAVEDDALDVAAVAAAAIACGQDSSESTVQAATGQLMLECVSRTG